MKSTPLQRRTPLSRGEALQQRKTFQASPAQRAKAHSEPCIVWGITSDQGTVDPAHLCSRARGGCDDPLCVVPLNRHVHRLFDQGEWDLLPFLLPTRVAEIQHALGHYDGDLIGLLHRLTGDRYVPERAA